MKKSLLTLLMFLSFPIFAAEPQMGTNFEKTVQVIPTDNKNKIEVMELFWYGCIHCYQIDPILNEWVKKLPKDVYFKRVPAIPRPEWAHMAKAFYAMDTLGVSEKLHTAIYDAVHKEKTLNPADEKAILEWVTLKSGLDRKKVDDAFNSFSINATLNKAAQIFRTTGATGVPSLVIDGKYITSSTMAGGNNEALKLADDIIANIRKDKK
ncbi:MAG: thiol:disulfide interchange protein DsbA/DsbL [Candidatus Methylopumilus sp.]|nr:thiol:disulfide interchange protein DsbA/DsbL [Candidatus Methylopumilus sp.]